jgi:sugar phosphate isomerase/epimerase
VADRVLLSAGPHNLEACVALARERALGLELMAFSFPDVLDGDWQATVERYRPLLATVPGPIALHGPYMDMSPGSPDRRINQVCMERFQHTIRIANALGARLIVFHANFIAALKSARYRVEWQKRNVDFWGHMAQYACQHDVVIAVENMWEFDPDIIGEVVRQVDHAHLRACLDVGHAYLFSEMPLEHWLAALFPYIAHLHINNNDDMTDTHQALTDGALDYRAILPLLRAVPGQPTMTLEMETVDDMRRSLDLLDIRASVK